MSSKYKRDVADKGLTSIIVKKTTRQRLSLLAHKHQTYDEILNELIQLWEQTKK